MQVWALSAFGTGGIGLRSHRWGTVFWFGQKKGDVLFYSHEKNAVCYGGTARFVGACSDERFRGLP